MSIKKLFIPLFISFFCLNSSEIPYRKRKSNQEESTQNKSLAWNTYQSSRLPAEASAKSEGIPACPTKPLQTFSGQAWRSRKELYRGIKIRNNPELFTVPDSVVQVSTTLCNMLSSTEMGNMGTTSSSIAPSLVEFSNKRKTVVLDLENKPVDKDSIKQIEQILKSDNMTSINDKARLIKIAQCADYLNIDLKNKLKFNYRNFHDDQTFQLGNYSNVPTDYLTSFIEEKKSCEKIPVRIFDYRSNETIGGFQLNCCLDKNPYFSQDIFTFSTPSITNNTQIAPDGRITDGPYASMEENIFRCLKDNNIVPLCKDHVMFKSNKSHNIVTLNISNGTLIFHRLDHPGFHEENSSWYFGENLAWQIYKLSEGNDHVKVLIFSTVSMGRVHVLEVTFKLTEGQEPIVTKLKPFLDLGECDPRNIISGTGIMDHKKKPVEYHKDLTVHRYGKISLIDENELIIVDEKENINTIDLNRYLPDFPEADSLTQIDKNTYLIKYNKVNKIVKIVLNGDYTVHSIKIVFDYKNYAQLQKPKIEYDTNIYQIDNSNILVAFKEYKSFSNINHVTYYIYNSLDNSINNIPNPINGAIKAIVNLGFNKILVFGKKIQELEYKIKNNKLTFYKNRTRTIKNSEKLLFPNEAEYTTDQNLVYAFKTTKQSKNLEFELVKIPLVPNFKL